MPPLCVYVFILCSLVTGLFLSDFHKNHSFFSGFCKLEVGGCLGLSLVQLVCTMGVHESAFKL